MLRRLELAIHNALKASASQRLTMVVDAINKDFSPELMIQEYNQACRFFSWIKSQRVCKALPAEPETTLILLSCRYLQHDLCVYGT